MGGEFKVVDVRLDADGSIMHIGFYSRGIFNIGDHVTVQIDAQRRTGNARSHSAGHLIDCAVTQLVLPLKPTKGYHIPEGAYVEYEGTIDTTEELLNALQTKINELVDKDISVNCLDLSSEHARDRGIYAPEGKAARIVKFEGFESCGCGGTHVRSSQGIGPITIRKIKSKKGVTRISYTI